MEDLAWNYPVFIIAAVALGVWFFWFLTRQNRPPKKAVPKRTCARCKLVVTHDDAVNYRFCPFCGNKY